MAWEPDRGYNFFFSPPAHLCAVTYMTEISLIVTLNNQSNPIQSNLVYIGRSHEKLLRIYVSQIKRLTKDQFKFRVTYIE